MSKNLGYVQWFDESSGEGMIFDPFRKRSFYVHWSAIKPENKELVISIKNLKLGQPVEFTLFRNLYMAQIDTVWPLHFNYTIANEHKLNRLMNQCFEIGDCYIFDLAEIYYSETGGAA